MSVWLSGARRFDSNHSCDGSMDMIPNARTIDCMTPVSSRLKLIFWKKHLADYLKLFATKFQESRVRNDEVMEVTTQNIATKCATSLAMAIQQWWNDFESEYIVLSFGPKVLDRHSEDHDKFDRFFQARPKTVESHAKRMR